MPNAGQKILAADFPATVSDTQNTSGTTTSTTYTATLTGGTACGVTFVAPTSGNVTVHIAAEISNSTTGRSLMSFLLSTGSTIGSGTAVVNASDLRAVKNTGTNAVRAGATYLVTGLTAGSTYNVQQQFSTQSATTGTFLNKHLIVTPVP